MSLLSATELQSLTAAERLALIDQLWDSLDDAAVPVSPAQQAELRRRIDSFDADSADAQPWEAVRAALAARAS